MLKKFIRDCRGNSMLEAAIVTPLLLVLTFGIVDFAMMFHIYVSMESGVSQATRYAVTGATKEDPDNPGIQMGREGTIKAVMKEASPSLDVDAMTFSFSHMAPGGSSWSSGAGGPGDISKVSVHYDWTPVTPILPHFLTGGKMSMTVESAMKLEPKWEE
jgi:Flp pilus assembly protein TadG